MKLHDLSVGQRFSFRDKHRGKVFEVTWADSALITYKDVATGEYRHARAIRLAFRMDVDLITENKVVELTDDDIEILKSALVEAYLRACEVDRQSTDGEAINKVMCKITGHPGRRVVLPED